jgi:hypothetical protein
MSDFLSSTMITQCRKYGVIALSCLPEFQRLKLFCVGVPGTAGLVSRSLRESPEIMGLQRHPVPGSG